MRFEDYVAERCAIAAREAREEGFAEGIEEGRAEVSALAKALASTGRTDELIAALEDQALFDSLLEEFGFGAKYDSPAEASPS